jgi:hypothetical protein
VSLITIEYSRTHRGAAGLAGEEVPQEEARPLRLLQQAKHDFRLFLLVIVVVLIGHGGGRPVLVGQFGIIIFFFIVQGGDAKTT